MKKTKNKETLVEIWDDVLTNINTLERYKSSKNTDERKFYRDLIKRGTCFVVYSVNGTTEFAPSRFIGYLNNTQKTHEHSTIKDGRITSPIIEKILGNKFTENNSLESAYKVYCSSLGITPNVKGTFGAPRKYILTSYLGSPESLLEDIQEIINNKTFSETERKNLAKARIGQGYFREKLIARWRACSVTGCKEISILKASHIKPWRNSTNKERLNIDNGLLLIPNLDALFDKGMISFKDDGEIMVSEKISKDSLIILGIKRDYRIKVYPEMQPFLKYHREKVFDQ
jgi:hypothetical protein